MRVRTQVTMTPDDGLRKLHGRINDQRQVLTTVGVIARREFAANFAQQGRPTQWRPLQPGTLAAKRRMFRLKMIRGRNLQTQEKVRGGGGTTPGILVETGDMRESYIHRGAKGNIFYISADGRTLTLGSGDPKAGYHEEGTRGGTVIRPKKPGGVLCWYGVDAEGREGWQFAKKVVMKPLARRPVVYISPEGFDQIEAAYAAYLEGNDPRQAVQATD